MKLIVESSCCIFPERIDVINFHITDIRDIGHKLQIPRDLGDGIDNQTLRVFSVVVVEAAKGGRSNSVVVVI